MSQWSAKEKDAVGLTVTNIGTRSFGNNLATILAMSAQRRYNAVQCDLLRIARKNNGFQRRCNAKPTRKTQVRILVPQLVAILVEFTDIRRPVAFDRGNFVGEYAMIIAYVTV